MMLLNENIWNAVVDKNAITPPHDRRSQYCTSILGHLSWILGRHISILRRYTSILGRHTSILHHYSLILGCRTSIRNYFKFDPRPPHLDPRSLFTDPPSPHLHPRSIWKATVDKNAILSRHDPRSQYCTLILDH